MARHPAVALACLILGLLTAACADQTDTLRPAAGPYPAIRARIVAPEGPGPFPAVILLHGCGGPVQRHDEDWAALFRAEGFLSAIADQHGPRGVSETCTSPDPRLSNTGTRVRDTYDLLRLLQARPDVRPDRIFVMGFSAGAFPAAAMATSQFDLLAPPGSAAPPPPRGAIGVYGVCGGLPAVTHAPVLLVLAELDDWVPPLDCESWVRSGWRRGPPPRIVLLEGARHGFDNPSLPPVLHRPAVYVPSRPGGGFGATVGHSPAATEIARRDVVAFLRELR